MSKGPILFDLDPEQSPDTPSPADAPPVPDLTDDGKPPPEGRAMRAAALLAARKPSRLARLFWSLLMTLLGVAISLAAWDFVTGLINRLPLLGYIVTGLTAALLAVLLAIAIREMSTFARLKRIDHLHRAADTALADDDLGAARAVTTGLVALYAGREDTAWGRARLAEHSGDQFDAATLLTLTEDTLLVPLDALAVTALVPLALADVVVALTANLRMIRRIAEIYGGRSGVLGAWRLTRAVMTHLVATGAVAVGDDLIGTVAGGSVLSKISRRFGEGVVNGALTARVGVAAMEVCRPLPFSRGKRPSVRRLMTTALSGLFPTGK